MKIVMLALLFLILAALAGAGLFMLKRRPPGEEVDRKMARALALRIALSVALFLLILLGWAMGWVRPGGLPTGR